MKKTLLVCILFLLTGTMMAQDVITTKEGKDIKAKVLEINSSEIKYLDYENLEGPTYVINKADVLLIRYQNGKNEVFNDNSLPTNSDSNPNPSPAITERMSYQDIKERYDYRQYKRQFGDPYNPTLSGVMSWLIPGLGQGLCDEWGRGIAFFGVDLLGATLWLNTIKKTTTVYHQTVTVNKPTVLIGAALLTVFDICNIVDAVRVAKRKNMYYQDLNGRRQASIDVNITPCFTYINTPEANTPVMGLSVNIGF